MDIWHFPFRIWNSSASFRSLLSEPMAATDVGGTSQPVLALTQDPTIDQTPWQLVVATILFVCLSILILYYLHGRYQNMRQLIDYADAMRKAVRQLEEEAKVRTDEDDELDTDDESEDLTEHSAVAVANLTAAANSVSSVNAPSKPSDQPRPAVVSTV